MCAPPDRGQRRDAQGQYRRGQTRQRGRCGRLGPAGSSPDTVVYGGALHAVRDSAQGRAKRQWRVLRNQSVPVPKRHFHGPEAAWRAVDRQHTDPDPSLGMRIRDWLGGKLLKARHWSGLRKSERRNPGVFPICRCSFGKSFVYSGKTGLAPYTRRALIRLHRIGGLTNFCTSGGSAACWNSRIIPRLWWRPLRLR